MGVKCIKSLLVAVFSFGTLIFSNPGYAQTGEQKEPVKEKKIFDANEVIFGHIMDAHEFHFLSYKDGEGREHHATIPLPVILYSKDKGFSFFMSSAFHHGEEVVNGYAMLTNEKIDADSLDRNKYAAGHIVAVDETGKVTGASVNPKGTSTTNANIRAIALRKAYQLKLNTSDNDDQSGTIVFSFKLRG